jgi:hypothetical protein
MTSLEFQPVCRCGFNGTDGPLSEILRRFENAVHRVESEITLFFQQDSVKSRVREWTDQKLEVSTRTLSYLEGTAQYPEIENLSLFDQHLVGMELVKPLPAHRLLDFLGDRVWEKRELLKALDQFFDQAGPRIVLKREEQLARKDLIGWCYEQALRHAQPLPAGFTHAEHEVAASLIEPRWVTDASLLALEDLGLGEEGLRRILQMILDGQVRPPETRPARGPVAAAMELLDPRPPVSAEELAGKIENLYAQNERFRQLRRQPWLALLDKIASVELTFVPEDLDVKLHSHLESQWVVVDCLGIPLMNAVRDLMPGCFSQWQLRTIDFAMVSTRTTTEAFYLDVLRQEFRKPFEKVDSVDALIHGRQLNLPDLARVARAELEIAFKKLLPRLDPAKPVLIFGDHGFRLAPDGIGFTHGGASTLERLTPVFILE